MNFKIIYIELGISISREKSIGTKNFGKGILTADSANFGNSLLCRISEVFGIG